MPTSHLSTQEIQRTSDSREIFLPATTAPEKDDDIFTDFARVVMTGDTTYSEISLALSIGQKVQTKERNLSAKREYELKDKAFAHEIAMELRARFGFLNKHIEAL